MSFMPSTSDPRGRFTKGGKRYYQAPPSPLSIATLTELVKLPLDLAQGLYASSGDAPSVTTILGVLAKPALVGWAARTERERVASLAADLYQQLIAVTAEPVKADQFIKMLKEEAGRPAHQELMSQAANIGTQVHSRIEWELKGELQKPREEEPPLLTSPKAQRSFQRWTEWRASVQLTPLFTERRIFSQVFGYGGTLDLVAGYSTPGVQGMKQLCAVVDWKTGKAVYGEAFLQNAAYRLALREEGIRTDGGWIVRLPKYEDDPEFDAVQVPEDPRLVLTFLALRYAYTWYETQHPKRPRGGGSHVA